MIRSIIFYPWPSALVGYVFHRCYEIFLIFSEFSFEGLLVHLSAGCEGLVTHQLPKLSLGEKLEKGFAVIVFGERVAQAHKPNGTVFLIPAV